MMENAFVFDDQGRVIWYHTPTTAPKRGWSGGSIPDTRTLWDILWKHRDIVGGVAHTHPWEGPSGPSQTDVTTFAACESGLGKRLLWPVVTFTHITYCRWVGPGTHAYAAVDHPFSGDTLHHFMAGITRLRELSGIDLNS